MKVRKIIDVEIPGLGERIRRARKIDKRPLTEIAEKVGMSPMNWYKIEAEETKALPEETLKKIEEVLGVDLGVNFRTPIAA